MRMIACSSMFFGMFCLLLCVDGSMRGEAVCDSKCRERRDFYLPGNTTYYHYKELDCWYCGALSRCIEAKGDNPSYICQTPPNYELNNRRWTVEGGNLCPVVAGVVSYQALTNGPNEGDGTPVDWRLCLDTAAR